MIAALLLALVGVPDQVIADDYVASDRFLGSLYDEWAQREEDPEQRSRLLRGYASEPDHMLVPLRGDVGDPRARRAELEAAVAVLVEPRWRVSPPYVRPRRLVASFGTSDQVQGRAAAWTSERLISCSKS